MTACLALLLLAGSYTSTPEQFLDSLCTNRTGLEGARFWIDSSWDGPEGALSDADSMRAFLEGMTNLAVEVGSRDLGEVDQETGMYRVEYPSSMWTWMGSDGRMYRISGPSVVIWDRGRFYWETLPVMGVEAAGVGITERFLTAIFFTVMILLFGVLLLVWARRRFAA
jgi:hypothetical protein